MPRWGKDSVASGTLKSASAEPARAANTSKGKSAGTRETKNGSQRSGVTKPKTLADVTLPNRRASDPVNPSHYQGDYVMRIIEDFKLGFCTGNVVKYVLRAGKKSNDSEIEDLEKAAWYLIRRIKELS